MDDLGLLPDEELLWSGEPDPSAHFTPMDWFFVPFSLLWAGFAVWWVISATRAGAPVFFVMFGSVFVLFSVYMVVGRFVVKAFVKRRTRYYVTSDRAIVVGPRETDSIALVADMGRILRVRRTHMDVVFGTHLGPWAGAPGMASLRNYANTGMDFFASFGPGLPFAFYDVADVAGLQEALHAAQASRSDASRES
jgi:hypothetical protein